MIIFFIFLFSIFHSESHQYAVTFVLMFLLLTLLYVTKLQTPAFINVYQSQKACCNFEVLLVYDL